MTGSARVLLLLGLAISACQHHPVEVAPAPAAVTSSPPTLLAAASRLPEDAEAGARSVAQWREHLEEEERERKLRHDRRKLSQHRRLSQLLLATRRQYDRAPSDRAVAAAQKSFRASLPQLEKSLDAIDHYGDSSRLLPEYRKLLELLSDAYPSARIAALAGSKSALDELEGRVRARFEIIDAWLREADRNEDD